MIAQTLKFTATVHRHNAHGYSATPHGYTVKCTWIHFYYQTDAQALALAVDTQKLVLVSMDTSQKMKRGFRFEP
jgi:hypothetical protein